VLRGHGQTQSVSFSLSLFCLPFKIEEINRVELPGQATASLPFHSHPPTMSMLDAFFSKGGGFRGAKWYARSLPPSLPVPCGARILGDPEEGVLSFSFVSFRVLMSASLMRGNSKTLLKLTIPRVKLLRNRRELQLRQMRRDRRPPPESG
jgi:hypothetical protein